MFAAAPVGALPTLWLRTMEDVTARPLPGTENAESPFWSSDGRWVAFFAAGKLKKLPASGGPVQIVADAVDPRGGTWGPDGTILFGTGASSLYRVSSAGGTVATLTKRDAPESHRFPQFLPDGHHFLFTLRSGRTERRGIWVGSLDGAIQRVLAGNDSSALYVSPGYLLYLNGDTLLGQAFDADRLELSGQAFTVAERVGRSGAGYGAFAASGATALAYAGVILPSGRLTWFDRAGNALNTVRAEGDYIDFRLSSDETRLADSLVDPKAGTVDIWLTDLARERTSRLTHGPLINVNPIWSPDGTRILFRANRSGSPEFYQISTAGGGNEVPVLQTEGMQAAGINGTIHVPSDSSPDDRHLIFSADMSGRRHLWLLPLTGDRKPFKFFDSSSDELQANFSPDGRFVAYSSNESGRF